MLAADTRRLREIKSKPYPWYVLESLLFENGYQAVVLYRLASWFKRHGIPFFGPLFARLSLFLTGVDIAPGATIGPGLLISHGVGIVIGDRAEIGANATLLHRVTVGAPGTTRRDQMPKIGDGCYLAAGATLIGEIAVGDNVFVGAHALVAESVSAGTRVLCEAGLKLSPRRSAPAPDQPEKSG